MPSSSAAAVPEWLPPCSGSRLLLALTPLADQAAPTEMEMLQFGSLFSLSRSEQQVLQAALAGVGLATLAHRRGVRTDTVRQQMKSVLAKTNCRSRKDLFRLAARFLFLRLQ